MDLQHVGSLFGGAGASHPFTAGISAAQRVQDAHGRYADAVMGGRVFIASNQALATLQTGLTTAQTGLGIYNPANSGKNLHIWSASAVNIVAQPTAGAVWGLCANTTAQQAAPTGQTACTYRNALLGTGAPNSGAVGIPLVAGTLAAAPVAIAVLGWCGTGAITVLATAPPLYRDCGGCLIVAPGAYLGFFASIAPAGSSFWGELIWEETPVLSYA